MSAYPFYYFPLSGFFTGLAFLFFLAGIALYVLRSLGLYRMAANTGVRYAWFAWIPLLHEYLCAKMGDRTRITRDKPAFLEKWMVVLAAAWLLSRIFQPFFKYLFLIGLLYQALMALVSIALLVIVVLADYWIYMDYEPSMAALYTVFSVFRLDGIAKFIVRENVPVGVTGVCGGKQPKYR